MSAYDEAPSEAASSECTGRESSLGSREDIQDIMRSLGITSIEELAENRFRVDRKRLERLMFGNDPQAASKFFANIMDDTKTHIVWPSRLKQDAKSKKDPHIRILGKAEDVKAAHDRVLASLDAKSHRVNMKIDVSYTEHSHIIGKGGATIKRVMEETGCHIHFPDSNRSNPNEKSNQVSIAGEVFGVEKARAKVRELTPLILCFELPILGAVPPTPEYLSSPFIKEIQKNYNVQVMFRSRQKLNSTVVVVKGCEWEITMVKDATKLLINQMCKTAVDQVSVHIMLEISPQNHYIVLGKNNENLKGIMANTKTQIIFQDPTDPHIPSIKKSNVTITGSIDNVYLARQQLIGSLPVVFMFEVQRDTPNVDTKIVNEIMNKHDVIITTRHRAKQNILTYIVKGIEKNVANIYEARRKLLGLSEPIVDVSIPQTYYTQNPVHSSWFNQNVPLPNMQHQMMMNPMLGREAFWSHIPYHLIDSQHLQVSAVSPYYSNLGQHSYNYLSIPDLQSGNEAKTHPSISSNASSFSSNAASPRGSSPVSQIHSTNPDTKLSEEQSKVNAPPGFKRAKYSSMEFEQMQVQAVQAMIKKPKASELRVPNSNWSGFGFSQSSPSSVLKEQSNGIKQDNIWQVTTGDISSSSNPTKDIPLSNSDMLDSMAPRTVETVTGLNTSELSLLLATLGLGQYYRCFEAHEIDMMTFKTLNDTDLKEIGVNALGVRRKLLLCIHELNKIQRNQYFGSAAPGAERNRSSNSTLDGF